MTFWIFFGLLAACIAVPLVMLGRRQSRHGPDHHATLDASHVRDGAWRKGEISGGADG